jgi:hypothetical protein
LGWKWSVASERHGVPIGWAIDGANRNDVRMLEPTIEAVTAVGLLVDVDTLHLDRGYDYPVVHDTAAVWALRLHGEPGGPTSITGTARSVQAIFYIVITFLSGHTEVWSPPGSPPWSHRGHRNLITWPD